MSILNLFKKKKPIIAIFGIKESESERIWEYITDHQDDSYGMLSSDLCIPYKKMVALCVCWACGDRNGFNKLIEQQ